MINQITFLGSNEDDKNNETESGFTYSIAAQHILNENYSETVKPQPS